jgi:hypothetical protein
LQTYKFKTQPMNQQVLKNAMHCFFTIIVLSLFTNCVEVNYGKNYQPTIYQVLAATNLPVGNNP